MKVGRGYQRVVRTAGNLTLNSTAWANTSTTLDLTLAASTGDVVDGTISGIWNSDAQTGYLNLVAVTGGAGWSTRIANTDFGVQSWRGHTGVLTSIAGSASRTMASADLSGGNVIVRIRHKTLTAANKIILATTSSVFAFMVRNQGPHVAP